MRPTLLQIQQGSLNKFQETHMKGQGHLCSARQIVQQITHIWVTQNKSLHEEEGSN